jgi:hypothetical protein
VDNIRTDLGEIGWDGVDWIIQAQNSGRWRALVNAVMNLHGFITGVLSTSVHLHRVR